MKIPKDTQGEICVKITTLYKWYNRFSKERESTNDDSHSGHPTDAMTEKMIGTIKDILDIDRCMTLR